MSKKISRKERDRSYHVMMYALSEENRIMKLSKEELARRQNEIWDSCYGEDDAA